MSQIIEIRSEEDWNRFLSNSGEKILFKYSPVCGISSSAEDAFDEWIKKAQNAQNYTLAKVDVIFSRTMVRRIATEIGVPHQSPQLLWFDENNAVKLHSSHFGINQELAKISI